MSFAAGLPTPPKETMDDTIKQTIPTEVPATIEERQIDAMSQKGLDIVRFRNFLSENEWMDYPFGILSAFFESMPERDQPDAQYFEQLGISHDMADYFAREYPGFEELGYLPIEYLVFYYGSLAEQVEFDFYREVLAKSPEIPGQVKVAETRCAEQLVDAPVGSTISVQVSGPRERIDGDPVMIEKRLTRYESLPTGPNYLYHSTTIENAISILMSGPLVGSPYPYPNDCDGGFYTNASPEAAMSWAQKCAHSGRVGIILVFEIPAAVRASWAELRMDEFPLWSHVVTAFRTKQYSLIDLRQLLANYDVISGPILANPAAVRRGTDSPRPLKDYEQVAFISHRLGFSLREYITGYMVVPDHQ